MVEDIRDLQKELRSLQEQMETKPAGNSLTAQRVALAQAFESIHQALASHEDYGKDRAGRSEQAIGAAIEILAHTLDKLVVVSERLDKLTARVDKMESNVAWMG